VTTARTTLGDVRGVADAGVRVWKGIPYASAPRFAAPEPVPAWTGLRDAFAFGPIAPQAPGAQFQRADLAQSEDCLSLNVWAPDDPGGRKPVLVWIHGGAFRSGSSASPLYDAAALARFGDVVVVTINYRLGALGFLCHPGLTTADGACGNWGLLDQIAALRWVRDNAAAFGGDPDNVTIFGESAGGASVSLLCVSPLARGLFHKGIAQSGPPLAATLEASTASTARLVEALGVDGVDALRKLPPEAFLSAEAGMHDWRRVAMFAPVVDGVVLDRQPTRALAEGGAAGIPLVVGTNVDEWKLWAPMDPHSRDLDDDGLRRRVTRVVGEGADEVISAFHAARAARGEAVAPPDLWFAIQSDAFFRVPALRAADAHASAGNDAFVYLFGWTSPAMGGWLGACHGLEIAFVFGTQGRGDLAVFTGSGPDADRLSDAMGQAWAELARAGNPSTAHLEWPAHDASARPTAVFDARPRIEPAPREPERAVLDQCLAVT
jgi:para-nitrobenzyl esterase